MENATAKAKTEKQIEDSVCRWFRGLGGLAYKFTSPNRRSVPDRLFLWNGQAVFVEFKRPGNIPTPAQHREMTRIEEQGLPCFWTDDVYRCKAALCRLMRIPVDPKESR